MIIKDCPEFKDKKAKHAWLHKHQEKLIRLAKEEIKRADGIPFVTGASPNKIVKATGTGAKDTLQGKLIINTAKLMDSHDDVHIPGLWDKSVSENNYIMLIREHKMAFDYIIADWDDITALVSEYTWKELGFKFPGSTEALQFNANIKSRRNPYMFNQYMDGYVKNHSVGMRYVRLGLAINDDQYTENYSLWEKYYPIIANKERPDELGYFWAVPEAKVIEGSAVPLGSNYATPTQELKGAPSDDTRRKHISAPSLDTRKAEQIIKEQFKKIVI